MSLQHCGDQGDKVEEGEEGEARGVKGGREERKERKGGGLKKSGRERIDIYREVEYIQACTPFRGTAAAGGSYPGILLSARSDRVGRSVGGLGSYRVAA